MVSILRLQRNHDKKPLLKNSPLRGLRCYVPNTNQQRWKQHQQKFTLELNYTQYDYFHYALIKTENIFFQFGGVFGTTWFKTIKLTHSIHQYVDFTTTFTTRWSRLEGYYLFHHATAAVEIPLFHLPPRLKAPILLLSRLSNQYPYHKLMI